MTDLFVKIAYFAIDTVYLLRVTLSMLNIGYLQIFISTVLAYYFYISEIDNLRFYPLQYNTIFLLVVDEI